MSISCETCVYYRNARPMSQLLARGMDVAEGAVATALAKIVEDEQKWLETEATIKRGRANSAADLWPMRPLMSSYCALREQDGVFLIHEIHNRGGTCTEGKAEARPRNRCVDCAHRRAAGGPRLDEQREARYTAMIEEDTVAQTRTGSSDESLLTKYREGISAWKAKELSGAYAAKGVLLDEPRYLDWCAALSAPDEERYVVCALTNADASCPRWTAVVETAAPAAPAPDGLTEAEAGEIVNVMCALLELEPTPELRAQARQLVAEAWCGHEAIRRFLTEECAPLYANLAGMHEAQADAAREQVQPGLVAALRQAGTAFGDLLVGEYDRVNAPLAAGSPALTREVADAFVDVLAFIDGIAAGVEPVPAAEPVRAFWLERMVLAWPRLPGEVRAWLAQMPIDWAKLRYQWAVLPAEQHWQFVQVLQAQLGMAARSVAAQIGAISAQPVPLMQPGPPATVPQPPAWATADLSGSDERRLMDEISSRQAAEEEQLTRDDPTLALQVKLHNRLERAALVTSLLTAEHQMRMRVIEHIGG
jgi:hypothetical protein